MVLFTYTPARKQAVVEQLLKGFQGFVQSDGYSAYGNVRTQYKLQHLGCWAHCRRKFDEAIKAQAKKVQNPKSIAHQALLMIQKLYRIEAEIKAMLPEDKQRIRQEQALLLLKAMKTLLDHACCKSPLKA